MPSATTVRQDDNHHPSHAGSRTRKVKRMTRTGKPVQVTDNGKPLWILQPSNSPDDEKERLRATDEISRRVLAGPTVED